MERPQSSHDVLLDGANTHAELLGNASTTHFLETMQHKHVPCPCRKGGDGLDDHLECLSTQYDAFRGQFLSWGMKFLKRLMLGNVPDDPPTSPVSEDAGSNSEQVPAEVLDGCRGFVGVNSDEDFLNEVVDFSGSDTLGEVAPQPHYIILKRPWRQANTEMLFCCAHAMSPPAHRCSSAFAPLTCET
jgi:hypothetical protein